MIRTDEFSLVLNQQKQLEYLSKYLESLGLNLSDPNYVETPSRIVRMHKEQMFGLTTEAQDEIKNILSKRFPSTSHLRSQLPNMTNSNFYHLWQNLQNQN